MKEHNKKVIDKIKVFAKEAIEFKENKTLQEFSLDRKTLAHVFLV